MPSDIRQCATQPWALVLTQVPASLPVERKVGHSNGNGVERTKGEKAGHPDALPLKEVEAICTKFVSEDASAIEQELLAEPLPPAIEFRVRAIGRVATERRELERKEPPSFRFWKSAVKTLWFSLCNFLRGSRKKCSNLGVALPAQHISAKPAWSIFTSTKAIKTARVTGRKGKVSSLIGRALLVLLVSSSLDSTGAKVSYDAAANGALKNFEFGEIFPTPEAEATKEETPKCRKLGHAQGTCAAGGKTYVGEKGIGGQNHSAHAPGQEDLSSVGILLSRGGALYRTYVLEQFHSLLNEGIPGATKYMATRYETYVLHPLRTLANEIRSTSRPLEFFRRMPSESGWAWLREVNMEEFEDDQWRLIYPPPAHVSDPLPSISPTGCLHPGTASQFSLSREEVDYTLSQLKSPLEIKIVKWLWGQLSIEKDKAKHIKDAKYASRNMKVRRKKDEGNSTIENIVFGLTQSGKSSEAAKCAWDSIFVLGCLPVLFVRNSGGLYAGKKDMIEAIEVLNGDIEKLLKANMEIG
eukprot:g110.t1